MKKLFSILLVLAISASSMALASCGKGKVSSDDDEEESKVESQQVSTEPEIEVPEEYKDIACAEALLKLAYKLENYEKASMILSGKLEMSKKEIEEMVGQAINGDASLSANFEEKCFYQNIDGEEREYSILTYDITMSIYGQIKSQNHIEEKITIGEKEYILNREDKTYSIADDAETENSDDASKDEDDFSSMIKNHIRTTKETVEGVEYTADWFSYDGEEVGILTLDGEIKYVSLKMESLPKPMVSRFSLSDDVTGAIFEIPEGYTEVSSEI